MPSPSSGVVPAMPASKAPRVGDHSGFAELVQGLAQCSRVFGPADTVMAARIGETIASYLRHKSETLVRGAGPMPILYHYSSDATAYLVVHVATSKGDGVKVVRKGKALYEYLCERAFLKTVSPSGEEVAAIIMKEPRPLKEGKGAWHLYSALDEYMPTLRQLGHCGITIEHFGFDRGALNGLEPLLHQRHALKVRHLPCSSTAGGPDSMVELLSWVATTGCVNHDCHNALRWALAPLLDNKEILKDLHIAVESLRNSMDMLQAFLMPFLVKHVQRATTPHCEEDVARFWIALGAEPEWAERLGKVNPWFRDDILWVSINVEGSTTALELVGNCLLYIFKFRRFTDSRWCTIGPSCRILTGALAVGLNALVSLVREAPHSSEYYLGGFDRCSEDVRTYAAIASVASYVPEGLLYELMEDDRVMENLPNLEQVVFDEIAYVESMPSIVWERLSHIVKGTRLNSASMHSAAVHSTHIGAAFLVSRVFKVAKGFPWRLCSGDIQENLQDLSESEAPASDGITEKVYKLMQIGPACVNYKVSGISDFIVERAPIDVTFR